MRILVVGHKGMLGHDLLRVFKDKSDYLAGADCDELDIREIESVRKCFNGHRPDVVINSAAYTNVDGAEADEPLALAVNGKGAGNIAIVAKELGARTIHISTDYVFDGSKAGAYNEDDPVNPINAYGRTKLAGERAVLEADLSAIVARTEWLYGRSGKNFVETMLRLAGERDRLTVVDDQHGAPTWTMHLAEGVAKLIASKARGIVHVTNSGATTWFKFTVKIFELAGIKSVRVEPMTSDKLDRPAKRPLNSVLDGSRFKSFTGSPMPHWEEGLEQYLVDRKKS